MKKVFCINCKHYSPRLDDCRAIKETSFTKCDYKSHGGVKVVFHKTPSRDNKNNDCEDYSLTLKKRIGDKIKSFMGVKND